MGDAFIILRSLSCHYMRVGCAALHVPVQPRFNTQLLHHQNMQQLQRYRFSEVKTAGYAGDACMVHSLLLCIKFELLIIAT